jgi:hypothetical protein
MFFVTELPVTFFLSCSFPGHFYLFFIQLNDFFICILCLIGTMIPMRGTMIKLDLLSTPLADTPGPDSNLGCLSRLLVLVPASADYSAATRRIWELSQATATHVRLLGLCEDSAVEPALRRGLVTMASLLQDGGISVEAKVDIGTNWVDAVKTHYETGDMIVCFAEQRTGLLRKPLSQVLESNLKATVYILSNLVSQRSKSNPLSQVSAWLGFIAIIIGFGILQATIVQYPEGWLQNILLILSTIPEFWLIWVWNHRFG